MRKTQITRYLIKSWPEKLSATVAGWAHFLEPTVSNLQSCSKDSGNFFDQSSKVNISSQDSDTLPATFLDVFSLRLFSWLETQTYFYTILLSLEKKCQ